MPGAARCTLDGRGGADNLVAAIDSQLAQLSKNIQNQHVPGMTGSFLLDQVSMNQFVLDGLASELAAASSSSSGTSNSFGSLDATLARQTLGLSQVQALNNLGAVHISGSRSGSKPASQQVINQISQAFSQASDSIAQAFLDFPNSTSTGGGGGGTTAQDVTTYHYDQFRTGANTNETTLTPQNVSSSDFGKLFSVKVNGQIYAQPLYVAEPDDVRRQRPTTLSSSRPRPTNSTPSTPTTRTPGRTKMASSGCANYTDPSQGLTPVPSAELDVKPIAPDIGITGTPVIDPSTNTMYFVTDTKQQKGPPYTKSGTYTMQLHAVNITTGQEQPNSPTLDRPDDHRQQRQHDGQHAREGRRVWVQPRTMGSCRSPR